MIGALLTLLLCGSIIGFVGGVLSITGFFDYANEYERKWVSYVKNGYISLIVSLTIMILILSIR